jgi:hypothetical protein
VTSFPAALAVGMMKIEETTATTAKRIAVIRLAFLLLNTFVIGLPPLFFE